MPTFTRSFHPAEHTRRKFINIWIQTDFWEVDVVPLLGCLGAIAGAGATGEGDDQLCHCGVIRLEGG